MAARKATKPMETDDAIVNIGYFDNRLDKLKGEIIDSLEKALKAHAETEAEAITGIWRAIHWRDAVFVGSLSVVAIIISIMSGLVSLSACSPMPSPPQQTAIALNNTYQAEATATWRSSATDLPLSGDTISTPTATYTPTPSPQPSPTPTLTPWTPIEVTPCGQAICVLPDQDEDVLARLCTAEVRGFGDKRRVACLSVISTVLTRMVTRQYSDGTVEGTIKWGCGPETQACAFPRYVVEGCAGILPTACPWNYPSDIAYFQGVARDALAGDWGSESGVCRGALYYDSRPTSLGLPGACVIRADNGQFEVFHND